MSSASSSPAQLLKGWLSRQLPSPACQWLEERLTAVSAGKDRDLFLAFGLAPRKVGKDDLQLTAEDLSAAAGARSGWDPSGWSTDQAARTLLVLSVPSSEVAAYVGTLNKLFAAAEIHELMALYQALPLLPYPEAHVDRAAEGIRSNMKAVVCAVAYHNPYPAEQLDEVAWNQLVLKCLFIDSPLYPIQGFEQRVNADLTQMAVDYAHERWAAGRPVSPELWRCVGPHASESALVDLQKVLSEGSPLEQQAAALALASCPTPRAAEILGQRDDLAQQIQSGAITWDTVGAACFDQKVTG